MADFVIAGWCPSAWRPWASTDGHTLRIRAPWGILTAAQLRTIAHLATVEVEISSRANIQLRGVNKQNHRHIIAILQENQLIAPSEHIERLRNILFDPVENIQHSDFVRYFQQALDDFLAHHKDLTAHIPAKFAWSLPAHPHSWLDTPQRADVRIAPAGRMGWHIQPRGLPWALHAADAPSATAATLALTEWVARQNLQRYQQDSQYRPARLHTLAEHTPPPVPHLPGVKAVTHCAADPAEKPFAFNPLATLGWRPSAGLTAAPAWGRLPAAALARLAEGLAALPASAWRPSRLLSPQMNSRTPRAHLAPWRALLIPLLEPPSPSWLATFLDPQHWITHPADVRLHTSACPGLGACHQARGATQLLARALAPHLPPQLHVHVSGCAKMCAKPLKWDYLLQATDNPDGHFVLQGKNQKNLGVYSSQTLVENAALIFNASR